MNRLAVASLLFIGATSCVTIPATGERKLVLVSQGQEAQMGKEAAEQISQSMPLYADDKVQRYVSELGLRLAKVSESPNLPWTFKVMDDPAVNAFALPGGYIFVTRGLMTHLSSEAQIAAVLGHEIGHVTGRHSAVQMTKQLGTQIAVMGAVLASETAAQFAQPLMGVAQLATLHWGRSDEEQADMLGFRYTGKTDIDRRETPKVYETLKRVSDAVSGGQRLPTYLSTHPDPGARVEKTEQRLAELAKTGDSPGRIVERDAYLKLIDGMVFGDDPRQGFFQGQAFKHPDMKFTFQVPDGWKGQNTAEAVVAQNSAGDGALQLTVAAGTPEEALRKFIAKEGMQAEALPKGLGTAVPSASGKFVAKGQDATLAGIVTFYALGGKTFQMLTLTKPERIAELSPVFERAHASFAPLTDPAALAAQPARLKIQQVGPGKSPELLKRESGSPASVATLAIINQIPVGETLPPNSLVKTVVGPAPLGSSVIGK